MGVPRGNMEKIHLNVTFCRTKTSQGKRCTRTTRTVVAYKNKQRRFFHTEVIRVFMGGEKVLNGTARKEDKEGKRRGGGKLRLIVRQVIYDGTQSLGPCHWRDRSSVAIAPTAYCAWTGLGACGDESRWRAAEATASGEL